MKLRLLLVGGGHSHLEILRRQVLTPHPAFDLALVSFADRHHYSGMVPGYLAGQYTEREIAFALPPLAAAAGGRFLRGEAVAVDPVRRVVELDDGRDLPYDLVSFGVGSLARGSHRPEVAGYAQLVKPISHAVALRERLQALAASREEARAVVVGAGAAGYEIACAVAAVLDAAERKREVTLVDAAGTILPGASPRLRERGEEVLLRKGIGTQLGAAVEHVTSAAVRLADGTELRSDLTVWLTGAEAPALFATSGLAVDEKGFLLVDSSLRSISHPEVFGAGDCVTLRDHPETPKAGVYAVREGPVLWRSLVAAAEGTTPPRYEPQGDFLSLLNTADGKALLWYRGRVTHGAWALSLKDLIDRRFLEKYQRLA